MNDDITTIPVVAPADREDDDDAEVEAIAAVAKALKPLTASTRRRVIDWAAGKYGATPVAGSAPADGGSGSTGSSRAPKTGGGRAASGTPAPKAAARRKVSGLSLDKTLDYHPKGVQSFADFVEAKKPTTTYEQNIVTVYWLSRIAGRTAVTVDQVYSCYKDRGWRVPADLRNNLSVTASTKGWIDTSNLESITVSIPGENYVEHDLPAKAKSKA